MEGNMKYLNRYNLDEMHRFRTECLEIERSPFADRKEGRNKLLDHLINERNHFKDSAQLLVEGCYGQGAYLEARNMFKNTRMNRRAWLFNSVAYLEYRTGNKMACEVWNSLPPPIQCNINAMLDEIIDSVANEG